MKLKKWIKILLMLLLISFSFLSFLKVKFVFAEEEEKWKGVDEAVIEKIAKEKGISPKEPLIPLEGDIELFAFSFLSGIAGFIAGYFWRKLVEEKAHAHSLRKTSS